MRRIIYFLFLLSYLNILTLIPSSCVALSPIAERQHTTSIGDCELYDTESVWEMLLSDVFDQKAIQYDGEDHGISTHYFNLDIRSNKNKFSIASPLLIDTSISHSSYKICNTTTPILFDSKNSFAQYYCYLFRLTPF